MQQHPNSEKRLSATDLYRLRRAQLRARGAALDAQLAQHFLDRLLLELERKYSLIAADASVDLRTGAFLRDQQERSGVPPPPYSTPSPDVREREAEDEGAIQIPNKRVEGNLPAGV